MKIVQVIPTLSSGGGERFVVDLSNELVESGFEVILCSLFNPIGELGFYKNQVNSKIRIISPHKKVGLSPSTFFKMIKLIVKEKPDVIHSHLASLPYVAICDLFYKGVHTIHNDARIEAANKINQLVRKFYFKLNLCTPITISIESQKSFERYYGYKAERIDNGRNIDANMHVSNSVRDEVESYKRTNGTKVIVQVARFHPQKNIPMMAEVAKRLYEEGYDFTILFIGSTSDESIYEEVKRIMPPCCHILGERQNPLEYMKLADVFALSSLYEGFPITLIEALGIGTMPVCTPVGGIPNVINDGYNGVLSKGTSSGEYYEALKKAMLMTREEYAKMKVNAIKSYEPYSMKKCASSYISLYKKLTSL